MNFTRDPIIETIITPRDGYKLLVRNSKGGGQEDYYVDAIEVVSFGHSFFFRSLERPKSFLVPVSDYEVIESKEVRAALKNVQHERSIKIGGGRDAPLRHREPVPEKEEAASLEEGEESEEVIPSPTTESQQRHNKRDRSRRNRRGGRGGRNEGEQTPRGSRDWEAQKQQQFAAEMQKQEGIPSEEISFEAGASEEETQVVLPTFSRLIPPPPTLISDTIARYKDIASSSRTILPPPVEPEEVLQEKEEEDFPNTETTELHRSMVRERTFFQGDIFLP